MNLTWEQLAHNDLDGKWGRQPTKEEIQEWIDFMKILLKGVKVGKQYAYISDDVATMEKLFGNTWLKNNDDYTKAYEAWDSFKELLVRSIHGMTVNERLFNLGLLEEFDNAVAKKDEPSLRAVLFKCFLDENNIQAIIDNEIKKGK